MIPKPKDINDDDSDLEALILEALILEALILEALINEEFDGELNGDPLTDTNNEEDLFDNTGSVAEESGEYSVTFEEGAWEDDETKVSKYHVNGVTVKKVAERVQYYDTDGKLDTESFKDFTRKTMAKQFASLDDFIRKWNAG